MAINDPVTRNCLLLALAVFCKALLATNPLSKELDLAASRSTKKRLINSAVKK